MRERISLKTALLLPIVALVLAGCSTGPRIVTNSDPGADWTQYRTFGFCEPLGTDRYTVRSITSNQLIEAAKREMIGTSGMTTTHEFKEMQLAEAKLMIRYFLNADADFLIGMGVDTAKLPSEEEWYELLAEDFRRPLKRRQFTTPASEHHRKNASTRLG